MKTPCYDSRSGKCLCLRPLLALWASLAFPPMRGTPAVTNPLFNWSCWAASSQNCFLQQKGEHYRAYKSATSNATLGSYFWSICRRAHPKMSSGCCAQSMLPALAPCCYSWLIKNPLEYEVEMASSPFERLEWTSGLKSLIFRKRWKINWKI